MAAGADWTAVRIDVVEDGAETGLSFPRDVAQLTEVISEADASLVILDPLLSRLDSALDSHKDAEVRQALEPLVKVADVANVTVLGLIHMNKGRVPDALTMLMGSRAFAAVARAVLFVMLDPDAEAVRLLGQPKTTLGAPTCPP